MTKRERVTEALRGFQRIWSLHYPEKGERRRKGTPLDLGALQESWNAYIRLNISYHGKYVAATDPNFLK